MKKEKFDYMFPFVCGGPILSFFSIYYGTILYMASEVIETLYLALLGVFIIPIYIGVAIAINKIYDQRQDAEDKEIYKYRVEVEINQDHKRWKAGHKYIYEPASVDFSRQGYFDRFVAHTNDVSSFSNCPINAFECPIVIINTIKITLIGKDENIYDELLQEHLDWITKHPKNAEYQYENASFFEKFYKEHIQ